MKRFLFVCTLLLFSFAGCRKMIYGTTDYVIVSNIESDIVVELQFDDRRQTTISLGKTQLIYHSEWSMDPRFEPAMRPEVLMAEMRINGKIISQRIWRNEYWVITPNVGNNYTSYTLTVTDELLGTITNQQN